MVGGYYRSGVFCEVMLSPSWWRRPLYVITKPVYIAGHSVPAGVITDGASVPRLFWPVFPPIGRYFKATIVHDFYLKMGVPNDKANQAFKQCLQALDIQPWRIQLMYQSVRLYGGVKGVLNKLF
jgi:hypothetical protein